MISKLAEDPRITVWRRPAQALLKCETIETPNGAKYQRPIVDSQASIVPRQDKFHYRLEVKRYYIKQEMYQPLKIILIDEMKNHMQRKTAKITTGGLKVLFDPNESFLVIPEKGTYTASKNRKTGENNEAPTSEKSSKTCEKQEVLAPEKNSLTGNQILKIKILHRGEKELDANILQNADIPNLKQSEIFKESLREFNEHFEIQETKEFDNKINEMSMDTTSHNTSRTPVEIYTQPSDENLEIKVKHSQALWGKENEYATMNNSVRGIIRFRLRK